MEEWEWDGDWEWDRDWDWDRDRDRDRDGEWDRDREWEWEWDGDGDCERARETGRESTAERFCSQRRRGTVASEREIATAHLPTQRTEPSARVEVHWRANRPKWHSRVEDIASVLTIDSHAHLEPRMLDVPRMLAKLDAARVDRVVLIAAMNDPLPETPRALLASLRVMLRVPGGRVLAERVHRATLTAEGDLKLGGKVHQIYARPDNESVARVIREYPDRFLGWIFLNPRNNPSVLDELERWRSEPGFIGVKLHPHWHDYRTEILDPILRRAEELRLPALVHLGFGARGDYRDMCARFPRLRVIAAHAGIPFFNRLWRDGARCKNLYIDLSSPYLDERVARAAVETMGAQRCLYGTDAPYGFHDGDKTYDYGEIRAWVERMKLGSAEQERVFGGNFSEIVGDGRRG